MPFEQLKTQLLENDLRFRWVMVCNDPRASGLARTGNWFAENSMAIRRLDKLSRNGDVQAKLVTNRGPHCWLAWQLPNRGVRSDNR